jgi:hypothetical protein
MRRLALLVTLAACSRSAGLAPGGAADAPAASAEASVPPALPAASSAPDAAAAAACPADGTLEVRTAEARSLYGDGVGLATVDGTFLFVDPDRTPLFPESVALARQALVALRHDRIAPRPLCPVSVFVFASPTHLRAYSLAHGYVPEAGKNLALYDAERGVIVTDVSGGRKYVPSLAHELAHVLMDHDFGPPAAPLWFRECVASLYEAPVIAGTEIHGVDNWRYAQLRAAVAARDPEAHLGALFGMSDREFRGRSAQGVDAGRYLLHLGMARATCQWLDDRGQLWPLYRAWRDGGSGDAGEGDGVGAFARVIGKGPRDEGVEGEWGAWVRGRQG